MRKGGGKQKGSQFEREVCVLLSRWITNGAQEDVFWRSAMSGGRATVAKAHGKSLANQVGDISCIDPAGMEFSSRFAVECKFYADLDLGGLFTGKGKLLEFWRIIRREAESVGKLPMLFARQNRLPAFICLDFFGYVQNLKINEWDAILFCPADNLYVLSVDRFLRCDPNVLTNRGSTSH